VNDQSTSLAEKSLLEEIERFRGTFRIDSALITPLGSGGQLIGPCFSRGIRNWAIQLVTDEDRSVERRHFVAVNSSAYGTCQAILDLHSLENKWHRPPVYTVLCHYLDLHSACHALLALANQYLDWRFAPAEALEAHIRYCISTLGLAETSQTEVVEPDKVYRPPYGAAFELLMEDTEHDLATYFNQANPPLWKPFGLSLGNAGTVQLAFVEDERWTESPYSQSLIYSGLCAFCRPSVTNERRAVRDLEGWLKEYRQLRGRSWRCQPACDEC
jgi:hypothetical protein